MGFWGDRCQEAPVGFPGVEQRSDPVVIEAGEPERHPLDAFDPIVDGFDRAVRCSCSVPIDDRGEPTGQRPAE